MAKKSAMSKGYRKTIKKKPFLTKKEIVELIVILAVIALGVILFNIFYDDGYLRENEVQSGDVVAYASSDLRDRYTKIAEIGEIEGFTLEERTDEDTPITAYQFTPDDEASDITSISVNGSFVSAQILVDSTMSYMASLAETGSGSVSEVMETTIQGHDALVYAYAYGEYDESYDNAEAEAEDETAAEAEAADEATDETADSEEEPADNKFNQSVSAYIALDDTYTLCLHISRVSDDASFYLADDELVDFVQNYSGAFTLVEDAEA